MARLRRSDPKERLEILHRRDPARHLDRQDLQVELSREILELGAWRGDRADLEAVLADVTDLIPQEEERLGDSGDMDEAGHGALALVSRQ